VMFTDPMGTEKNPIEKFWAKAQRTLDELKNSDNPQDRFDAMVIEFMLWDAIDWMTNYATLSKWDIAWKGVQTVAKPVKVVTKGGEVLVKTVNAGKNKAWTIIDSKWIINSKIVRYTQDSISGVFRNWTTIKQMTNELREWILKAEDVEPIRIFIKDWKIFSLDNRRLKAFQDAKKDIMYELADEATVIKESWKMTTKNEWISIRIR
jgi:hypothetical protein